jgi:hypothetical protein
MGTKFKEINTLSFIAHIRPKTERLRDEYIERAKRAGQPVS